jgi:flagellar hook protein FlgE
MGLSSVLSTAITGLQAAETTIDVAGNNVANSNTIGFKASRAVFATQFLQTLSLGSAPTTGTGGTNPRQVGLGVQVAGINPDFKQGTLEISSSPSDLAIQGQGFFIVQSSTGETLYTRNGKFLTNANNELVTISGERLMGFGVDENFEIQQTTLVPLTIPLGAAAVAKATENVVLEGTLTPTGDLADTAEIIQSGILGDAAFSAPSTAATPTLAPTPDVSGVTTSTANGGALTANGTYRYVVVFADSTSPPPAGTESTASLPIGPITLTGSNRTITLDDLPVDPTGTYTARRIYRTTDGGSTYYYVGTVPNNNPGQSFTDSTVSDTTLLTQPALNTDSLTGNYSYFITFANAIGGPGTGIESRPSPVIGPLNVVNGRIQLDNIPVDTSGQWTVRRIYRNLATDSSTFHFVAEIPNNLPGQTYTDNMQDSVLATRPQIDPDGPRINTNTLLTNVLQRSDNTFTQLFQEGTLSFSGRKGGRLLGTKELTITASTTVLDLMNFLQDALGIARIPGPDPNNPIPGDSSGANPGATLTSNGQIRLVGNNGVDNRIEIGLSALQLTAGGSTAPVSLHFSSQQNARGQSAVADFIVYDSLGMPLNVRVTAVLERRTGTETVYRWFANSPDNDPLTGVSINVGTGIIVFDGEGRFVTANNDRVSIDRRNVPSASPLEFKLDFTRLSGLADARATLAATRQDGFKPGKLTSFIIGEDGVIRGVFDNGTQRDLGQIRLARFANDQGLEARGLNLYAVGVNSGLAVMANPGEQGLGQIIAGAVEQSNTDIGKNLIDLIVASTQYRGSTRVITAAQQLLDELLNLRR